MEKRVLDLNAGLGGRIYAFEKAGFEISAVIDKDFENCAIISSWVNTDKIINRNLLELKPNELPDADIIAQFSKSLSITALISKPAFSNAYILPPNPAFKSKTLFSMFFCYLPYIFYNSISKQLKLRT